MLERYGVYELIKLNKPELPCWAKPNTKKKLLGIEPKLNRNGTIEANKNPGPNQSGREETELRNDKDT